MEYIFHPTQNIRLSVGELSEMCGVTPRTLRLYHERGLLMPEYIDTRTGYRYYSTSQLPRLEMILQMRNIGLSLKRIENILKTKDLSVFETLLSDQIDEIDEKIAQYTISRKALSRQLNSCRFLRNPPVLDHIFIEFIPKRRAIIFDIDEYDFRIDYGKVSPWKLGLDRIRAAMTDEGIPLTLFSQVGCMVSRESLQKGHFLCSEACLLIDAECSELPCTTLQSGIYACMYRQYVSMDSAAESMGLQLLMDYIAENNYQIMGPYLGQVIAESSVFNYSNRNILVKQQIPVAFPN